MIPTTTTLEQLEAMSPNTLVEHLGIEYTSIGEDIAHRAYSDARFFEDLAAGRTFNGFPGFDKAR